MEVGEHCAHRAEFIARQDKQIRGPLKGADDLLARGLPGSGLQGANGSRSDRNYAPARSHSAARRGNNRIRYAAPFGVNRMLLRRLDRDRGKSIQPDVQSNGCYGDATPLKLGQYVVPRPVRGS